VLGLHLLELCILTQRCASEMASRDNFLVDIYSLKCILLDDP
jgi:hypothetical protein